jgi:hypothetical protein
MRFEALSICFCCLALSFTCVPQLYMGFPLFNLLIFYLSYKCKRIY